MIEKEYLLFDLDGTLTDPKEGITKSVRHALRAFDIEVEDLDQLCRFIGPPLKDSFKEYYDFSEDQAQAAVVKFREYFTDRGLYENKAYPGMRRVLEELRAVGKKLYVATSKPEVFAKMILEHFDMAGCFLYIGGADLAETRVKKGDVIRYVLEENHITDLSKAVMIGDRRHDCLGAAEAGIASVGVLYGYGSREELEEAGADAVVETIEELRECLAGVNWGCEI